MKYLLFLVIEGVIIGFWATVTAVLLIGSLLIAGVLVRGV